MIGAGSRSRRSSGKATATTNRVIELHDGLKLIPIEADSPEALREAFADVEELGLEAREAALDDAGR